MINNEDELTKNFPPINNPKYKTPKWIEWVNLILIIGLIPLAVFLADLLYKLKILAPKSWQLFLNDQYWLIVGPLIFPICGLIIVFYNYLQRKFLTYELFSGETDYIIAYQENINLKNILKIYAKTTPPNTKIFIYAYNREQQAKVMKRYLFKGASGYGKERKGAIAEAKAQGIDLDLDKYPLLSIKKSSKHQNGNVNLIQTINLPISETSAQLEQYLPEKIDLNTVKNTLLKPNFENNRLIELVIRVTVYSENEFTAFFEVLLNPMETAFCVEI